jgi:hypothetical protein
MAVRDQLLRCDALTGLVRGCHSSAQQLLQIALVTDTVGLGKRTLAGAIMQHQSLFMPAYKPRQLPAHSMHVVRAAPQLFGDGSIIILWGIDPAKGSKP